ncbi:MAG: efflux RND transporter permease subunit [Spirochaetes bacterium]|nr:efflux RND transporter permease subunit [Spirochaetota bacterium]
MRSVINYFLTHHRITNMFILLLFMAGIFSLFSIKREILPEISFDIVQIRTVYPGASPEDVELYVTDKIEERMLEVENIKKISSMSFENLSVITLILDGEAGNPEKIKEDIREALSRVSNLPPAVTERPEYSEIKTSNFPVIEVALSGDDEREVRRYTRDLEDKLKSIQGVARIERLGYRKREIRIEADVKKMMSYQVPFESIVHAIRSRNVRNTGGTLESYVSEKNIVTLSEFTDPMEVKDVIVRSNLSGYSIRVGDLADVKDIYEEPMYLYHGNGKRSIGLIVISNPESDIIRLGETVFSTFGAFKKSLPASVNAKVVTNNSVFTKIMISMMISNGLLGFFLVLILLFIFLDFKSGFWSAFGIPFSVITSFALFSIFGISINTATLLAMILLIGILVDDAIVITENIHTIRQEGKWDSKSLLDGVMSMAIPVAGSIMTTILAFFPIIFIPGVMGRFGKAIPGVVIILLAISFIDSIFFLPVHMSAGNKNPGRKNKITKFVSKFLPAMGKNAKTKSLENKRDKAFNIVLIAYESFLAKCLKRKGTVLTAFVLLLVLLIAFTSMNIKFMLDEDIDPDTFQLVIEAKEGTPLLKTEKAVSEIEKAILEYMPENILMGVSSEIGHHDTDYFGTTLGFHSNWALINVNLIPSAERDITCENLIAGFKQKADDLKSELNLQKLTVDIPAGLPVGKPVEITMVSGNDLARKKAGDSFTAFLEKQDGVINIETTDTAGKDELAVLLDYKMLSRLGLTSYDVASTIRSAFEGEVVTTIRNEGETVDFRIKLKDSAHFREDNILDIPVTNSNVRMIRLRHVARLEDQTSPAAIAHYGGNRSVTISANIDENITTSSEINAKIKSEFENTLPSDVRIIYGGEQAESQESMSGIKFAGIFVVVSIYFILVILFDSYLLPAMIMSVVPFAIGGTFLTLLIHGRPLIMISLLGMIGLIGVVVNDTIVMINHLSKACKAAGYTIQNCIKAASARLRPVVLTTLTTFAGLLPAAYGLGGDVPSIRPMVLVMAWGIVFCTIVTLIFIPALFAVIKVRKPKVGNPA